MNHLRLKMAGRLLAILPTLLFFFAGSLAAAPSITSLSTTSGPVGTTVTITGTAFGSSQGASTIKFNGTAATVCGTCWSDTSIVANVPTGATTGSVVVRVGGVDSNGVSFTVNPVPTGWTDADVGTVGLAGSGTFSGGAFSVAAAGHQIWGAMDGFNFVYQSLSGDGTIVARISGFSGSTGSSQAGLMIRESLNQDAINVFTGLQSTSARLTDRTTTGDDTNLFSGSTITFPVWFKLVRTGNVFKAYTSHDGASWDQISTNKTVSMAQSVYVGLASTSGSTTSLATASFDSVSVTSSTSTPPAITGISATTGAAGAQVTLSGTGFGTTQSASFVSLNAAPVPINSWSDTSISLTIPSGATSGLLAVSAAPNLNSSNAIRFQITSQPLPTPWLNQDVGTTSSQGTATFANGSFTLVGSGPGMSVDTTDAMHFAYRTLSGDGSIVARVSSITGSSIQAGVMIRETLTANSSHTFLFFQPNSAAMFYRTSPGGVASTQSTGVTSSAYPYWLRLVRSGSTFAGYMSVDGLYWVQIGTNKLITMSETVSIGLAIGGGTVGSPATVTFDNVSVSSTVSSAPTISSISATTGSVGSQVSIYGTGFGGSQGSSVATLSGANLTINSWSDTLISATIPSGATTGLLVVSVAPSMNNSNAIWFTITSQPLATTWLDQEIGNVGLRGSATFSNGTFTIKAAGQGITGTEDGFHFVYQALLGDGSIVARVASEQNASNPLVGVMIRENLGIGSANAFVRFWPNAGTFSIRTAAGATTTQQSTFFSGSTYPYWVKLSRTGNSFSAYVSLDGLNWTQVGTTQTIAMAQNALIGMAATNQSTSTLLTATLDSVSVSTNLLVPPVITDISATTGGVGTQVTINGISFGTTQGASMVVLNGTPVTINSWSATSIVTTIPTGATSGYLQVLLAPSMNASNPVSFTVTTQPLPTGWLDADVGAVGAHGSATYSSGTFTITGVGQINGTADALHLVYQPLVGDGIVVARVNSVTGGDSSSQLGVMIRETLNANAPSTFVSFYPSAGFFYYRTTTGGSTTRPATSFSNPTTPYWVKLVRTGTSFSAYVSGNGTTWTQVGTTQTISMAQVVYVGLGLANWWNAATTMSATFDNVSITPGTMPMISAVSPASGTTGTSVTVSGSNFGSPQGTSSIKFNGTAATSVTSWTNTQIVAAAPSGASTGPVTVTVSSIQSNNDHSFTLYTPAISSLSPPAAQTGAIVVVVGSGFGNTQVQGSKVTFSSGKDGQIITWGDTSIRVGVPAGTVSGPVTVTVGGITSNGVTFSVEPLSVTGISPSSGAAGSTVTINGTGFGATQTSSTVDFYGTSASIQSWSDTQIVAVVPQFVSSGSVNVNVGSVIFYGPQFTATRTIQLTDSQSHSSTYTSALIGGVWVPTVGQGSGCSTCTQRGNISYTYDAAGNPLSRTDENGFTTSYTYDSKGNVLTVTVPINSTTSATTTYTYNSFGQVLTSTDPLGNVTTNTYDEKGNLLSIATPAPGGGTAASVTRFGYDSKGELTQIIDPLNSVTTITYFASGLVQTVTDAQSHATTYAYDSRGNRTSVTDALSHQTTFAYDAMNRLTTITDPDTTTTSFAYDTRGRRTSMTDQNGKVTTYAYDDADRLTSITDASSNVTTYGYDTESNLTSVQDANLHTTNLTYDAFGRITQTTFPSGSVENYSYDNVGNLTSKTDRKNQQVTYSFDRLNRLTQKSYPDTTSVSYAYDLDSRLTQVTDPTGTYAFTFDNMGRLTNTTTNYSFLTGRNFTAAYTYDKASNRTGFTDPEGGSTTYVYDTLNRLQTLTPPAAFTATGNYGFSYDVLSRRTQMTRPNAVTTVYTFDNLSRLTSALHQLSGSTLDGTTYTVDSVGNRAAKTDQRVSVTTTYTYDSIYQLTQATQGGTPIETYSYDAVGNRLSSLSASPYAYNSSNQLTSIPSASFTYDANGNTLTKVVGSNTTTYAWDFENRLSSVTLPASGGTVSFKYDPFGRRIYKSSASSSSAFAYDGDNLIEETNSSGSVVARYIHGLTVAEPLSMLRSSTTSFYQADGLGSVTSLSNASGALVQTYNFDSFGQTTSTGSVLNPFQYTSGEFDADTNLYNFRARYYDPGVGRFLSEDPIAFGAGDVDFYRYVGNNPTNLIDPFGLSAVPPVPFPWPWIPGRAAGDALEKVIGALGRAVGVAGAAGRAVGIVGAVGLDLTLFAPTSAKDEDRVRDLPLDRDACPRPNDPCKGMRDQLRDHLKRLSDYAKDPYLNDNNKLLGKGRDIEVIAGRVRNLLKQIENFRKLLKECEARNGYK